MDRGTLGRGSSGGPPPFELEGRDLAAERVTPAAVVEDLDTPEGAERAASRVGDTGPKITWSSRFIEPDVDSIAALSCAVPTRPIEGRIPDSRSRRPNSSEVYLRPLVRVMDQARTRSAVCARHVERRDHELGPKVRRHRPPAHPGRRHPVPGGLLVRVAGARRLLFDRESGDLEWVASLDEDVNLDERDLPVIATPWSSSIQVLRALEQGAARKAVAS